MLTHTEGWRWFLACSRRSPRGWRWSGCRRNDDRRGDRDDLLILVIVLIVVIDLDHDADLDFDLVGVVQFDGVTLEHLGCGGLRFFLVGVDGRVGGFLGHSGSYVADR
jgi:hypothetical protein